MYNLFITLLGQPVAGNFYFAEWDETVPEIYKAMGVSF